MTKQENWLKRLSEAGIENPAGELRCILRHHEERGARRGDPWMTTAPAGLRHDDAILEEIITRRCAREPLAKILGYKGFWKDDFLTNEHTLDPRPDSETLIEVCLDLYRYPDALSLRHSDMLSLRHPERAARRISLQHTQEDPSAAPQDDDMPKKILELGVGTGCLILSLLKEFPGATGVGVDISEEALKIARQNALRHREILEENRGDPFLDGQDPQGARHDDAVSTIGRLTLLKSDWFNALRHPEVQPKGLLEFAVRRSFADAQDDGVNDQDDIAKFDLIISNPPYISEDEQINEEAKYDPKLALYAKDKGLAAYKIILRDASEFLMPNGYLVLEIGPSWDISQCKTELTYIKTVKDLAGHDRVVVFRKT
ncbi:MAG: peptide chain release factor N(5)-glutamine methyltransferase [Alphaproteobacteria bacterium]|nr:MAG: peptide chain release factor N(5)-glutamine methyltransferase [Alphaproteobacteria bacterium]